MGQLREITRDLCSTCVYRTAMIKDDHIICNYIEIAGHSRVFEYGEQVVPSGYCDKYEEGQQILDTSKRWCEEAFMKEISIHREGVAKWQT